MYWKFDQQAKACTFLNGVPDTTKLPRGKVMARSRRSWRIDIGLSVTCLILVGCIPEAWKNVLSPTGQVFSDPVITPGMQTDLYAEVEENDGFSSANMIYVEQALELSGTIAARSDGLDRDMFDLGPIDAGTRIRAELEVGGDGDVVLGLFDGRQSLLGLADPDSWLGETRQIEVVFRQETRLYLGVAARAIHDRDMDYTVRLSLSGNSVLGYQPQVLLLDFDGADKVKIGRRPAVSVPAFDAAMIDERFAGQTETLIASVVTRVREDYAGLDVSIYRADDPAVPPGEHTVIYFGTYDEQLLGLADEIDPFNADREQGAIIFTDVFSLFNVFEPELDTMAQVLANVTSHEAGHLLGLRHTSDVHSLMDVTASASEMLRDQWFRDTALHYSVLPMGYQDGPQLLSWAVGGELEKVSQAKRLERQKPIVLPQGVQDFYIPRDRLSVGGGACDLHAEHVPQSSSSIYHMN
jgi:hypothetical protein